MTTITSDNKVHIKGLVMREPVQGPEWALTESLLEQWVSSYGSDERYAAVFVEPSVETGYPDIVLAEYSPTVFDRWKDSRNHLRPIDVKLLHYLYQTGGADTPTIQKQLGMNPKTVLSSVEHLLDAGVLTRRTGQWQTLPLAEVFALTRIVAVEAKMNDWKRVFQQAHANYWFASESYVLTPVKAPSAKTQARALELGVGIFAGTAPSIGPVVQSMTQSLPVSYGSWMFNEWLGRFLFM